MLSVRLVLMRPRNADNVGAVARAMKNFGFDDWVLVEPNPKLLDQSARKLAVRAEELLETVRVVADLGEAVADCTWVVGTTMRQIEGKQRLTPRAVAQEARTRAGRVAIVFGDERSGLTNDDLQRCHDLSSVPTGAEQPSLNLAQAVLVYCYELFVSPAQVGHTPPPPSATAATAAELATVEASLRRALSEGGFLRDPERHAVKDLMSPLRRSRLTRAEAKLWNAALSGSGPKRGGRDIP